jgi:hypothetical protein
VESKKWRTEGIFLILVFQKKKKKIFSEQFYEDK